MLGISLRDDLGVVPPDLVLALRNECDMADADGFWEAWSKGAEDGLFRAYCPAGGPTSAGMHNLFGWGAVRIRRRRLGGRSVGGGGRTGASRLYRVSQGDEIDAACAHFLLTLLSLWFFSFVGVLSLSLMPFGRGIKQHGFTQTRWDALQRY